MVENLETLLALARAGTMIEASTELRISQSAVSKRIAALEKYYNRPLIQKKGRRVELTRHGQKLVDKISPFLSELRDLFLEDSAASRGELMIGVSDAILSSWGASAFHSVSGQMPEVQLTFHAHRTSVVLDRIRSGEFMLGICTGLDSHDTDLQSEILAHEPMVIIPSGLKKIKWQIGTPLSVISIEDYSGAWRSFGELVSKLGIRREVALESFFSVAQMGVDGFGHALVPMGVARALGISDKILINLGGHGLMRPVRFVARKSTYSLPVVSNFFLALRAHLKTTELSL